MNKTGHGHCAEQQLVAQRPSMSISGAADRWPGEILGILNNICAYCEPIARCPADFYAASLS
jgi:hypothetical protein